MAQEIERKFLVLSDQFKSEAIRQTRIVQGYLSSVPERSVRIRIKGEKGFITVKGGSDASGLSRYEWEKEIPVEEALELMQLCEPGSIDKIRYEVERGTFTFEVDEFFGENEGLVMAEIELNTVSDSFDRPSWLGDEVTGDPRYYNVMLTKHPYKNW